jgi:hypothetical protein
MLVPRYLNVTYNAIKARAVSKRITIKHKCSLTMKVMNFQSIRSILKRWVLSAREMVLESIRLTWQKDT